MADEINEDLLKVLKELGRLERELDYDFEGRLLKMRNELIKDHVERIPLKINYASVVPNWTCPICETNQKSDFSYDNGGWQDECKQCGLSVDLES